MRRMEGVVAVEMTEKQRAIAAEIERGPRGRVGGLMALWLHSPDLAEHAQRVGAYFRTQDHVPPHLIEMVILTTAQHWQCEHEWLQHEPLARAKGLSDSIIEAIRRGSEPQFEDGPAKAVYEYAAMMLKHHQVTDQVFAAVKDAFGPRGIVDLSILMGHYIHGAILLNAVKFGRPEGAASPFESV
jgi:4-carboxymuconolactone decarboxylase